MKINWKARLQNLYFWIGIAGVMLTATGAKPEMFTSWKILVEELREVLENPFLLGTACLTVLGVLTDSSTQGFADAAEKLKNKKNKMKRGNEYVLCCH